MMRQAWLVTGWMLFLIQVGGCGLPTPERLDDNFGFKMNSRQV